MRQVQSAEFQGEDNGDSGEEKSWTEDPKRTAGSRGAQASGRPSVEGENGGDKNPAEGNEVERSLQVTRRPEHDQDEAVADGKFEEIASPSW